jgi:hypothetical protein
MKERIAIISGFRSPMGKAGGVLKNLTAHDLGARILKEVVIRSKIDPNTIDEVIIGNVAQPAEAANIARVIALKAGLSEKIPAFTVHRNCASGMEAITVGATKILNGDAEIIVAGGVESMSNIPLFFNKKMTAFFEKLFSARYLAKNIPPREWPIKIIPDSKKGIIFSNHIFHSKYLALNLLGMDGNKTSYSPPTSFGKFCFQPPLKKILLSISYPCKKTK